MFGRFDKPLFPSSPLKLVCLTKLGKWWVHYLKMRTLHPVVRVERVESSLDGELGELGDLGADPEDSEFECRPSDLCGLEFVLENRIHFHPFFCFPFERR